VKTASAVLPPSTGEPSLKRLLVVGAIDIAQRSLSYAVLALVIFFVGICSYLTLFDSSDRLDAARLMIDGCVSTVKLFTVFDNIPVWLTVCCIAFVI